MMEEPDIYGAENMLLYHTKGNPGLLKELYEYEKLFTEKVLGAFKNGEDRLFKLQYIQYEWVRLSFELARRNLWFNSGLLYWMLADCWPAASGWALIDYYGLPKASYYSFKRCAKKVVGSIDKEDGSYSLNISNDGLTGQTLQVSINKLNYKTGKVTLLSEQSIQVDAQKTARIAIDCVLQENEIILCNLQNEDIWDRCFYKEGRLEMVKTDCLRVIENTENSITVEAKEYIHAVALEGIGVFSDNYFSLLPGQCCTISFVPIQAGESDITCVGYTLA
jgi:beta-mannosidase